MSPLLIATLVCVFFSGLLIVIGLFRPAPSGDFDAAFRVNVDNLNRTTLFDVPELRPLIWPLHQLARRLGLTWLRTRILKNLRASGNPKAYSPDEYLTLCLISALGGMAGLVAFWVVASETWPHPAVWGIGLLLGFWACEYSLSARASKRLRQINVQLPYGLDLIAMTMAAGATFYEATRSVVDQDPERPLNQELGIVVREIEFGRSRQEALQHLAERIPLKSLGSIIAAILQAEKLGTPLAEVLRLQANLLRMYRSMRAEKALGEATVKMLLPMMLIFLSVILIIFGPILVRYFTGTLMMP